MIKSRSYKLSGADRFQLFFDSGARKNTGIGNVIRAVVTLSGTFAEQDFRNALEKNPAFRFLSSLSLKSTWYSPLYALESKELTFAADDFITFHPPGEADEASRKALSRDCNIREGSPIHVDVIPASDQTLICISANHVLLDHAGMENLLSSLTGEPVEIDFPDNLSEPVSFLRKFNDAVRAARFVFSRSGWNMKHFPGRKGIPKPGIALIELTKEEVIRTRTRAEKELNVNNLSFFLSSAILAVHRFSSRLSGSGKYFIAVPVDRRRSKYRNTVPGNYISFLYFTANPGDGTSLKTVSDSVASQLIDSARKKIPDRFSSLLDLFRYVPPAIYKAFIGLPGRGKAGTFAFSLLNSNSFAGKSVLGVPISDVTHYPPVISPPGLNVVFMEYNSGLKIIVSFDEDRIGMAEVEELMTNIKNHLIG